MKIIEFEPDHAAAFEALNRGWLVDHGLLEPADEPGLQDPVGTILALGGQIYVAVENGNLIGTCGIAPHGPSEFEILKLAVASSAQGRGIGRELVERCVEFARAQGAERVTLLSSSKLGSALRLYERVGFRRAPLPQSNPYETADVHMVLHLKP